jgi:hypothetical protein
MPTNPANLPKIEMLMISNVFFRTMIFDKAGKTSGNMHKHHYDHVNLLTKGSLELEVNGVKTIYTAPSYIFIHKEHRHRMTALEDDTMAICIHAIRDDIHEDIIDPSIIPPGIFTPIEYKKILKDQGITRQKAANRNPYTDGTVEFEK